MSANQFHLVGRLTVKPEQIQTKSGVTMAKLCLATDEKQNKEEYAEEFHKLTVFGKTADYLLEYADADSKLYVEGRIRQRTYDYKGKLQSSTELSAYRVELFKQGNAVTTDIVEDDVPF